MKNVKFYGLITLVVLSLSFSYVGCGGGGGGSDGGGGGGGGDGGDLGTVPEISPVILLKIVDGVPTQTLSFDVGDIVNISVIATDPDLDMNTLFTTPYLAPDFDSPAEPDIELELPSQTDPTMEYFFNNFIEISEDLVGNWRLCFWIVDNAGNESNEFCVNMIVNETANLTDLISAYMAIKYNQGISDFEDDDAALDREMAAAGQYGGGAHVIRYIQLFPDHIQDFVNDSIQYVSQLAKTSNIDKIAIEQIFENYRDTDLSYMNTYTRTEKGNIFNRRDYISIIIGELTISINDIYDLAILELRAL